MRRSKKQHKILVTMLKLRGEGDDVAEEETACYGNSHLFLEDRRARPRRRQVKLISRREKTLRRENN